MAYLLRWQNSDRNVPLFTPLFRADGRSETIARERARVWDVVGQRA